MTVVVVTWEAVVDGKPHDVAVHGPFDNSFPALEWANDQQLPYDVVTLEVPT